MAFIPAKFYLFSKATGMVFTPAKLYLQKLAVDGYGTMAIF